MPSNIPVVRQIAWISVIPQLLFMALLMSIFYLLRVEDFYLYGAFTYLVISLILRYSIPSAHRTGMNLVKQKSFQEAISYFQKSYDFFRQYSWVDKYRFITLLTSSKMCYKEMALNNIAFCYGQLGNGEKAIEYYERTLREYPGSELATAGLNLLRAGKK